MHVLTRRSWFAGDTSLIYAHPEPSDGHQGDSSTPTTREEGTPMKAGVKPGRQPLDSTDTPPCRPPTLAGAADPTSTAAHEEARPS